MKSISIPIWKRIPDYLAAIVLLQTLYFKFSSHPDSVYIFTEVGLEPEGRIGIGILELISAVLLVFRRTAWAGAALAIGIISGAIMMHFTQLGIVVRGDGGTLFFLAVTVWLCSAWVIYRERLRFISIIRGK